MGYANTKIRLDFPDLSEDDDPIYVVIRNPRTVPGPQLIAEEVPDGSPNEAYLDASFAVMARLVSDWHVYDGTVDDGAPLELPATVEAMRKLPMEITVRLSDEIGAVTNPPR